MAKTCKMAMKNCEYEYPDKIRFDLTDLFTIVRMAQSWHGLLPDRLVAPDQMTRDDIRAEAAAFMQDGGQTSLDLDGIVEMSENNGIHVIKDVDIEKFKGKEYSDRYLEKCPVGVSGTAKDSSGVCKVYGSNCG